MTSGKLVIDPATGDLIATCPESSIADAQAGIDAASAAFPLWKSKTGRERANILRKLYDLIIENQEDLATIISWENGKASPDAKGEVLMTANFILWFSEEAPRVYGDIIPHSSQSSRTHVLKEPIGVCGLITP